MFDVLKILRVEEDILKIEFPIVCKLKCLFFCLLFCCRYCFIFCLIRMAFEVSVFFRLKNFCK